jgi:DNA-binding transcriptional MerR regulator
MHTEEQAREATYGIGTAARLTGLTVHTIRVWERRYEAVVPERSEGGRRRYSVRQVERLGLLKQLTDLGESIGSIASLDDDGLRQRLCTCRNQAEVMRSAVMPPLRVAVLSGAADRLLERLAAQVGDLTCVTATADLGELMADLKSSRPNVLLLEYPAIDTRARDEILTISAAGHGALCVVLYRFAPSARLGELEDADIVTIRGPADDADLIRALIVAPTIPAPEQPTSATPSFPSEPGELIIMQRRFSDAQLDRLARVTTSVDCECPWHLVDLIRSLTAFEVYSARCESESPQDAELHAYLHAQTSRARALIEESMVRLMEVEGIETD